MFLQLVVVLLGVWMPLVRSQAGSDCFEDQTQAITVVLNGERNLTGSWISEVVVHRSESESIFAQAQKWSVQVVPRTFQCGNGKTALEVSLKFIEPIRPTTPAIPAFFRVDYEMIPGLGHYKFHATGVTWPEARDACAAEGSHLMIINSQEEVEVFKKLFAQQPTKIPGAQNASYAWLGVFRPSPFAPWVSLLGGDYNTTGLSRWKAGRPVTAAGRDYVAGFRTTGELFDDTITDKYAFVCEHRL